MVGVGGVAKGRLIAVSAKDVEYVRVSVFLRINLGCLFVLYDDIIESKKAVRNDDSNDKKNDAKNISITKTSERIQTMKATRENRSTTEYFRLMCVCVSSRKES